MRNPKTAPWRATGLAAIAAMLFAISFGVAVADDRSRGRSGGKGATASSGKASGGKASSASRSSGRSSSAESSVRSSARGRSGDRGKVTRVRPSAGSDKRAVTRGSARPESTATGRSVSSSRAGKGVAAGSTSIARRGSGQSVAAGTARYGYRGSAWYGYPHYYYRYPYYYGYPYSGFGAYSWYPYWGVGWYGGFPSSDHLFVSLGWYDAWPYYYGSIYYDRWSRDQGYRETGVAGDDDYDVASIEIDIQPRKARLVLNGEEIGKARDYDGRWDVLRLKSGVHQLEFRADGYRTLRIYLDARSGRQYRVDERLQRGDGLDPRSDEPPAPELEARRDEPIAPAPAAEIEVDPAIGERLDLDLRAGSLTTGFLRLTIAPDDAAVYLDGEFLARAGELARLHGAISVAGGSHTVEVVHPRLGTKRVEVEIEGDATEDVEIDLRR